MLAISWKEIQKNLLAIVAFMVLSVGLILAFNNVLPGLFLDEREMLDTNYGLLMGIWVNMIVFSGLFSGEKEDDQSHGYEFYKTLPISDTQIVLGKFLTVIFYAIVGLLSLLGLMNLFPHDNQALLVPEAYLMVTTGVSLVLVGTLYPLCFRWGYSRVMPLVMLIYIAAMMLPEILHLLLLIADQEKTVDEMFYSLTIPVGLLIMGTCVCIFAVLAWRAIKVKEKLSLAR